MTSRELAAMTPDEAAAYWFVRHDGDVMTMEDEHRFRQWLAASDVHLRAYEQTGAMWSEFVGAADPGELRALRVAALAAGPAPRVWPRAAALAASILLVVGVGGVGLDFSPGLRTGGSGLLATARPPGPSVIHDGGPNTAR